MRTSARTLCEASMAVVIVALAVNYFAVKRRSDRQIITQTDASSARAALMAEIDGVAREKLPQLKGEEDLDRCLQQIESSAREKHQVSYLDVAVGRRLIRGLSPVIGADHAKEREAAFSHEIQTLSAELDGRPVPP